MFCKRLSFQNERIKFIKKRKFHALQLFENKNLFFVSLDLNVYFSIMDNIKNIRLILINFLANIVCCYFLWTASRNGKIGMVVIIKT